MNKEIEAAVKWWTDTLRNGAKQDNGDPMCNMMALFCASTMKPLTDTQLDAFSKELTEQLRTQLSKTWDPSRPTFGSALNTLDCDYGPNAMLSAAAIKAGIATCCPPFPMKTCMWIMPGTVEVRYGYRADTETVYQETN